jgi:cyclophilin family peptidyl-prolyl cis-trans isomerase
LEWLEDRLTPATTGFTSTAPGVITGLVFVDSNNNGVHDPGELVVPGVSVTLTGTTNQGQPVNVSTTTDANGAYTFFQISPGTYTLSRGAASALIDGPVSFGNLGGTIGPDAITTISVAEGQTGVNYNFAVRGLAPAGISLRQFLNTSSPITLPVGSPGSGQVAADNTVQPPNPAPAGTSSLAGTVSGPGGIAGVSIALTGIDDMGTAILLTTTTAANGGYQFNALRPGSYTLNVTGQPDGFRAGLPTVGSLGGQVFRNDQIIDIPVGTGTAGTNYNFAELPARTPPASNGPGLVAELLDDTAGPGGNENDRVTSDPTIHGVVASASLTSFQAGFDAMPQSSFVSILGNVSAGGNFLLNPARLAEIAGQPLADGPHTLHLVATDAQGRVTTFDYFFSLDTATPTQPTLRLDTQSDPNGTGRTTSTAPVTLMGHTTPGSHVVLFQGTGTMLNTTADAVTGNYSFANIQLASGANNFTVQATDSAGNTSQLVTFFVRESPPTGPTSAVTENVPSTGADQRVDLSAMFSSGNFSNSIIRMNTILGPIYVQVDDSQAPQTVANFLNYVTTGRYNNDIFHRLATNFVLQGGGFTFQTGPNRVTAVTTDPTVANEFDNTNRPNVVGTIAMAKLGGDPNSASSQFFFNLVDNTTTLGPDNNGGFTVFGKVMSGADMRIVNTLSAFPVHDESLTNSAFNTLPLQNYSGTNFPNDATAANFALISSIDIIRRSEQLTYSVINNSNPSAVTATIIAGDRLNLHPLSTGTSTVTVRATDLSGATVDATFTVNVT